MAPSRLTNSQKQELLVRYRAGESTAALAAAYGCSANTVSRTVRTLLSPEDYDALKSARARASLTTAQVDSLEANEVPEAAADHGQAPEIPVEPELTQADEVDGSVTLALDDADDFGDDDADEVSDDEPFDAASDGVFQEIAVLPVDLPQVSREQVSCRPFVTGSLPDSVYMLVDKTVELDPRPLSEFPELGVVNPEELARQALCLYSSPRSAKRQCGRSQRVIKVPDTQVFERTSRHLLARGITRLVLEGALYSLDV
ncbi:hypothetical protein MITS9509_00972 [Synechococcus sp. MIT S9509]|uniref:helix-turn-helix domain-containing protein n=1 Tax=unclassified Synechococcus TaxID=2626047 RepID=UPI0007BBB536|nr:MULTISPECIES: helix-turn-helix domain-containing protein [unclassified Synechococcus]KZR87024.1 hypothetical protein MITS9504_01113 [Synechococcus sp. MIT S9504]KZR93096.1 hypothetical protein MITS9509_00972 [Synechococcus sp. MIT S9509]